MIYHGTSRSLQVFKKGFPAMSALVPCLILPAVPALDERGLVAAPVDEQDKRGVTIAASVISHVAQGAQSKPCGGGLQSEASGKADGVPNQRRYQEQQDNSYPAAHALASFNHVESARPVPTAEPDYLRRRFQPVRDGQQVHLPGHGHTWRPNDRGSRIHCLPAVPPISWGGCAKNLGGRTPDAVRFVRPEPVSTDRLSLWVKGRTFCGRAAESEQVSMCVTTCAPFPTQARGLITPTAAINYER
jgi:hypothetical protein